MTPSLWHSRPVPFSAKELPWKPHPHTRSFFLEMSISAKYQRINVMNCSDHELLSPNIYTWQRRSGGRSAMPENFPASVRVTTHTLLTRMNVDVVTPAVGTATAHARIRRRVSCSCFLISFRVPSSAIVRSLCIAFPFPFRAP